ncbi:MAG: RNA polymerase sigma-70 factor [Muribaculaceae bacterium]|nr:RNA polymerase sigma-70 factor [Muribaculaceae bacterium]
MSIKEFEQFFRRLYLPLGMYALRIVDDADIAEDMVQDAFIKVWRQLDSGRDISNFRAFMYKCVRNECLTYLSSQRGKLGEEFIPEVDEEEIDTSFRDARIWKAIDELPEKCREIFLMSKRDGYSNDEIADELGISVKTVKNQMTKAFSRLREALSDGHKPFFLPFLQFFLIFSHFE